MERVTVYYNNVLFYLNLAEILKFVIVSVNLQDNIMGNDH